MADKRISEMSAITALLDADLLTGVRLTRPEGDRNVKITWDDVYASILASIGTTTNDPTGFKPGDLTKLNVTIDDPTRTISLTPTGTDFNFWVKGVEYVKTGIQQVTFSDTEGLHYFYYDNTGTLLASAGYFEGLIQENALVAACYWDATNKNSNVYFTENNELHGLQMDGETHDYLHEVFGTRYVSGLALSDFSIDGTGNIDADAQFSFSDGVIRDEDKIIPAEAIVSTVGVDILYRTGANGDWRSITNPGFSMTNTGSGRVAWNEFSGGTWGLSEANNNALINMHIYDTNGKGSYKAIVGQETYTNVVSAREGAATEIANLKLNGLPAVEWIAVGTDIVQTSDAYLNAVKARIRSTGEPAPNNLYIDWTKSGISPGTGSAQSHTNLADLWSGNAASAGNAGHPQFAYRMQNIVRISAEYGEYTTIQAALDATPVENTLFLVGPGLYIDDTIYFTANSQTVLGASEKPSNTSLASVEGKMVDDSGFSGCAISRLQILNTNVNSVVNMVEHSSTLSVYRCHVEMNCIYSVTGAQPAVFRGTGTVNIAEGSTIYTHSGALNTSTDIKHAFNLDVGGIYRFGRTNITVLCSNSSFGAVAGYGLSGEIHVDRCDIDVEDVDSKNVAGIFLAGSGEYDFHYNDIKITTGGINTGAGLWITGNPTVRNRHNNMDIIDTGINATCFGIVMSDGTVDSYLSTISAKHGDSVTGGTLTSSSVVNGIMATNTKFLITQADNGEDAYYHAQTTSPLVQQEWKWGLQGTNGQWTLRDVTNNKAVMIITKNSPQLSFAINENGSVGFGTATFQIDDKMHIFDTNGTGSLFRMKNSGLMTSQISGYEALVTGGSHDFVTAKWVEDLGTFLWDVTGSVLHPTSTTYQLAVGVTSTAERAQFHTTSSADSLAQFTNTSTGTGAGEGTAFGVSGSDGLIRTDGNINFNINSTTVGTILNNGVFQWQGLSNIGIIRAFAGSGGTATFEFDINSSTSLSAEISASGGLVAFGRIGEAFTTNDVFRIDVNARGITKYVSSEVVIVVPTGTTNYDDLDTSLYNSFVFDTATNASAIANIRGFVNANSGMGNVFIIKRNDPGTVTLEHDSNINQELIIRDKLDVTLADYGVVEFRCHNIGTGVKMYTNG